MREIALFEADLGQNMRHLAQEIKRFTIRFRQVNPEPVKRNDGVIGEAATPFGAATSSRPLTAFLANVTAFFVKREFIDIEHRRFLASSPKF